LFLFAQVRGWGDNFLYVAIHFAGAYFISVVVAEVNPITSEYGTWAKAIIPAIAITIIYFYNHHSETLYLPALNESSVRKRHVLNSPHLKK
jgi:hypothetical protein